MFSFISFFSQNWFFLLYSGFLFILIFFLIFWVNLRTKFLSFFCLVVGLFYWGLLYSLDGIMFIFFLTEALILIILLLAYTKVSIAVQTQSKNINFFIGISTVLYLCFFFFWGTVALDLSVEPVFFIDYYNITWTIVSSDFFIFFYFFFCVSPLAIIFLAFILGFFSIFFILLFFCFKYYINCARSVVKSTFLLRKQALVHQGLSQQSIISFQL